MPRLANIVPKYRKHKQSGQAVVTLNGRDHLLGPHGTRASKVEYDRLIAEWLASGRSTSYGAPQHDLTIVELVVDYLKYARGYYGAGVRGSYATAKRALRPLKRLYGRTAAADFGVVQFKAVRQALLERDLARSYINETMRRIVAVFRWGAAEGRIPAAVPQNLAIIPGLRRGRSAARETAPVKPVDASVVEATIAHLTPVVADMVRLQQLTGARPGEVCRLTPGAVDRSGDVWEARLTEHKTAHHGHARTLYLGPQAQDVLRPYLLRPADAPCFSPAESMEQMRAARAAARKTPMSCGNRAGTNRSRKPKRKPGTSYTTQSYGRAIARGAELAKVASWSPNQLRHAVATRVRREFDIDAAKTLLGHASIGTTEVYAEQDRQRAIEVARAIG